MKNLIIALSVCMFLASCYTPERNCKDFRTGTFTFQTYMNGKLVKTKFTRNDSVQVEYFQGKIDSFSVRWINDCEYILKNLHPETRAEEKPLYIKILTTHKNTYTFEFSEVESTNKQQGTATKIK